MNITSTVHNHCELCDGSGTLDELIRAAAEAGFTDIGISCHGVTPFELEYSLKDEKGYISAVRQAAKKFEGVINVALGVEQDFYAPVSGRSAFDYIIGSVHDIYDEDRGIYHSVDDTPEKLRRCVDDMFGGDALAMVRRYYELAVENVQKYRPDIVGHFDLVTKFNGHGEFFDESSPEYRSIALEALERICSPSTVFEVNTGAMSRGWRAAPYPAGFILRRMRELKVPVTVSTDCHSPDKLTYGIPQALEALRQAGYSEIYVWRNGRFTEEKI
ncbi:MAG: histidinol-phosphatase [Oscillospiraceae bacterium]|nr:histidinol-phosphatase [Oscillospiraceae bacterium]